MTRIGKVTANWPCPSEAVCFHLVIENGRAVLGCWRPIGWERRDEVDPRRVFERRS
jgi:hypothetical protein